MGSQLVEIDETDRKILRLIQEDGRLTNAEIATRIGLSQPACWKRLKRLEATVVKSYNAALDPQSLGLGIFAFVNVMLDNHSEKAMLAFEASITAMPNVLSCHNVSGKYDYLLQIIVSDMETFHRIGIRQIRELGNVKEIYTGFSLTEIKRSPSFPI